MLGRKGEREAAGAAAGTRRLRVAEAEAAQRRSALQPACVLYHELVLTKKEYMRCVSAVELQWLSEIAPHMYSLKDVQEMSGKIKMPKGQRARHR